MWWTSSYRFIGLWWDGPCHVGHHPLPPQSPTVVTVTTHRKGMINDRTPGDIVSHQWRGQNRHPVTLTSRSRSGWLGGGTQSIVSRSLTGNRGLGMELVDRKHIKSVYYRWKMFPCRNKEGQGHGARALSFCGRGKKCKWSIVRLTLDL